MAVLTSTMMDWPTGAPALFHQIKADEGFK